MADINVELVYIDPAQQILMQLYIPEGATIRQAIIRSGLLKQLPKINLVQNKVGIYNEICELEATVQAGDRIEIYRPLKADPKEARRRRASLNIRKT